MVINNRRAIIYILSSLIFIVFGIVGTLTYQRITGPKQTVTISGTGEIDAQVDQATITIQVKNTSTTYALALEANQKDVASLKNSLFELGVPESRISQSSYQPPFYKYQEDPAIESNTMMNIRPIIVPDNNLTVTTNLIVILDTLKNIDQVYKVINDNPNTKITSADYSLKNQKEWETKAKEVALKDARSQVESIAKINKLKVGKLVSITDNSAPISYMGQDMMYREVDQPSAAGGVIQKEIPTYYSEQTVKIYASYTTVYELY